MTVSGQNLVRKSAVACRWRWRLSGSRRRPKVSETRQEEAHTRSVVRWTVLACHWLFVGVAIRVAWEHDAALAGASLLLALILWAIRPFSDE
jgi:hypothetical protein